MKRLIALVLCLLAQPAAAEGLLWDFKLYPPLQAAMMNPDGALVYSKKTRNSVLNLFVLKGSGENDWTEAFEIINTIPKNEPKTVKLWYEKFQAAAPATCAGEWVLIEESEKSITFEHRLPECPPAARETTLNRVLYGQHNVFRMRAAVKGVMTEDTRNSLLALPARDKISD